MMTSDILKRTMISINGEKNIRRIIDAAVVLDTDFLTAIMKTVMMKIVFCL